MTGIITVSPEKLVATSQEFSTHGSTISTLTIHCHPFLKDDGQHKPRIRLDTHLSTGSFDFSAGSAFSALPAFFSSHE